MTATHFLFSAPRRFVAFLSRFQKPKRIELRCVTYEEAHQLLTDTTSHWTLAPEEDSNRSLEYVFLQKLDRKVAAEAENKARQAGRISRWGKRWLLIPKRSFRLEWQRDPHCASRKGWTVIVDGSCLVQFHRGLPSALLKAWRMRSATWHDDSIA